MQYLPTPHPERKKTERNKWGCLLIILLPLGLFALWRGLYPIVGLSMMTLSGALKTHQYKTNLIDFLDHIGSNSFVLGPGSRTIAYSSNDTLVFREQDYESFEFLLRNATADYELTCQHGLFFTDYIYCVEFSNGIRAVFELGQVDAKSIFVDSLRIELQDQP